MNAAEGVRIAVIGQTIVGCKYWTSVRIVTVCVVVSTLGMLTGMSTRVPGGDRKVAVEHGSFMTTEKFA